MASSSKRERELARMRAQRQAARRAAAETERRKRRNAILAGLSALSVAAVIVIIALVTDNGSSPSSVAQSSAAPGGACTYTKSGTATKPVKGLPPANPDKKGPVAVDLSTNRGPIELTLDGAKAPCTTNSFTFLAGQKYFDGTSCHRLTTRGIYVLQCGDPTPLDSKTAQPGSGGPGYQFADENLTAFDTPACNAAKNATTPCEVTYPRGTVAMANGGPGTNGSQFFLVYKDSRLGPAYTPFGRITKGMQVLDTVAKAGTIASGDGKPNLAVTLKSVTVAG